MTDTIYPFTEIFEVCDPIPESNLRSEVCRLNSAICEALNGPDDAATLKSILFDALNGYGAGMNLEMVRAKHGTWAQHEAYVKRELGEVLP